MEKIAQAISKRITCTKYQTDPCSGTIKNWFTQLFKGKLIFQEQFPESDKFIPERWIEDKEEYFSHAVKYR